VKHIYLGSIPTLEECEYVVVSATEVFGRPETYIFPSDENGKVTDWLELEGSFQGEWNIDKALSRGWLHSSLQNSTIGE